MCVQGFKERHTYIFINIRYCNTQEEVPLQEDLVQVQVIIINTF